jgi:cupin superfamily acireductone dioxygenase involved in methionine salvage
METKKELTEKILKITILIQEKYPQLSKYLAEVEDTLPTFEHPEVDAVALAKYYQTLEEMLKDYLLEHPEL